MIKVTLNLAQRNFICEKKEYRLNNFRNKRKSDTSVIEWLTEYYMDLP